MSVIPQFESVKKRFTNAERREHIKASIYYKKKMNTGSQDNARINHMMAALAEAGGDTQECQASLSKCYCKCSSQCLDEERLCGVHGKARKGRIFASTR